MECREGSPEPQRLSKLGYTSLDVALCFGREIFRIVVMSIKLAFTKYGYLLLSKAAGLGSYLHSVFKDSH